MNEIINKYSAYGMNISSEILLPDLVQNNAPADISIRFGKVSDELLDDTFKSHRIYENPGVKIRLSKKAMYFDWDKVGRVLIRTGSEVIVEPDGEALEEDLQPFITGPVLSVLLHQRGYFVLHSSAVEIDGATVAFLGAKGFGKSTLAGYLKSIGYRLISDDIVPVSFINGEAMTIPGFPRIKLYDDSIEAMGEKPADFPPIHRFVEKRSFKFKQPFSTKPEYLHAVYILSDGKTSEIETMSPVNAFIEVLKNTYFNSFLKALNCQKEYFDFCQKFVKSVPVFRLKRPLDFDKIEDLSAKIENHVRKIFGRNDNSLNSFDYRENVKILTESEVNKATLSPI